MGKKNADDKQSASVPRKKRRFLGLKIIGVFLLILLAAVAGFALFSILDSADPLTHIPKQYLAYVSLPAAGSFVREVKDLKVIDSLLADESMADMRGLMRTIRANEFLQSKLFLLLANMRLDAAVYDGMEFVVIGDLGLRSMLSRVLPLLAPMFKQLQKPISKMEYHQQDGRGFWVYKVSGSLSIYIGQHRNLLFAASSYNAFTAAFKQHTDDDTEKLAAQLRKNTGNTLNFLADANIVTASLKEQNNLMGSIAKSLSFKKDATFGTRLANDHISLSADAQWISESPELRVLLGKQSPVPTLLSRLPQSTAYFTLINAGDPEFLWKNLSPFFDKNIRNMYKTANDAAKLAFRKTVDELLFSWMGSELGMFGLEYAQSPVFFTAVKNEKICKDVLNHVFASIFVDQDVSALVDGRRIPRIEFPKWLTGLLKMFGITLPRYFYVLENGYLYLSASAEVLAITLQEIGKGELLVKTDTWKTTAKNVSAESSLMVYYRLDRSIPFFLQSKDGSIQSVLRSYGRGIASLKFSKQQIHLDLAAYKTPARQLGSVSGFPLNPKVSIDSDLVCGRDGAALFAYWSSGKHVFRANLLSGALDKTELDDIAWIRLKKNGERVEEVWALSRLGTVYKLNAALEPFTGFPILTGMPAAAAPVLSDQGLIIPLTREPFLLIFDKKGNQRNFNAMHASLRFSPAADTHFIAALPRSFISQLYLFDQDGIIIPSWPVDLDGIAAVSPLLISHKEASREKIIALTEKGDVSVYNSDGTMLAGFPLSLHASIRTDAVYSSSRNCFYTITNEGNLYQIDLNGTVQNMLTLDSHIRSSDAKYMLTLLDLDGDSYDELALSAGGNAVYCFTGDLLAIAGFPIEGIGQIHFYDIDGDGKKEIISRSIDNKIHAYSGVGE